MKTRDKEIQGELCGVDPTQRLKDSVKTSVKIISWSLVTCAVMILTYWPYKYPKHEKQRENGIILLVSNFCFQTYNSTLERFKCHQIDGGFVSINWPMFTALCGPVLIFYIQVSRWKKMVMVIVYLWLYIIYYGYILTNPDPTIKNTFMVVFVVSCISPTIALKLVRHRGCRIWLYSLSQLSFALSGSYIVEQLSGFRANKLVFLLFWIPLVQSWILFPSIIATRGLLFDSRITRVNREYAWFYLFTAQFFSSTWSRMVALTINDNTTFALYLIGNAMQEVFKRVTIHYRAFVMRKFSRAAKERSLRRVQVTPSELAPDRLVSDDDERKWFAMLSLGDMMAESFGILINVGCIIFYRDAMYQVPMLYYAEHSHPLGSIVPIKEVLTQGFIHISTEFLLNVFCIYVLAHYFTIDVVSTWRSLRFTPFLTVTWGSAWMGLGCVFVAVVNSQYKCPGVTGLDTCDCQLLPDTLYHRHCLLERNISALP